MGDRHRDPRPPDLLGDPGRDRDGGRRPVDQLLAGRGPAAPVADPAHGGRDDGHGRERRRLDEPPRRLGRPRRRRPRSPCTAPSPWRARSTSGCGSSTGPAGSRSSSAARATRSRRSACAGRSSRDTTGWRRFTARSRPARPFGMSAEDLILAHLAKAADPSSGGRRMPGHDGPPATTSSPCPRRSPPRSSTRSASRSAPGPRRPDPVAAAVWARGAQPGRHSRGAELRGDPQVAGHLRRANNGYAISVPPDQQLRAGVADRAVGYGFPASSSTGSMPSPLRRRAKRSTARAAGGRR